MPGGAVADRRGQSYITTAGVSWSLGFGCFLKVNHYYRFVFLDGCETAKKPYWAKAFGIQAVKITDEDDFNKYYKDKAVNCRRRPSAFCGWKIKKLIGFVGTPTRGYKTYREVFRDEWRKAPPNAVPLDEAHAWASLEANIVDQPGPNQAPWGDGLEIFGYTKLLFGEFNLQSLP